jgi:hypothetical protein
LLYLVIVESHISKCESKVNKKLIKQKSDEKAITKISNHKTVDNFVESDFGKDEKDDNRPRYKSLSTVS